MDIYDPAANSWTPGPPLPAPREAAAVVSLGGRLYVIGGRDASGATATMYVLDISTAAESGPEAGALALSAPAPNPASGHARLSLEVGDAAPSQSTHSGPRARWHTTCATRPGAS